MTGSTADLLLPILHSSICTSSGMLRYTNYWMLFIVVKLLEHLMAGGESFEIFLHISACVKGTDVQVWDVTQLNKKDAVEVSGLNPHQMETDNGSQAFAVSSGGKRKSA